MGCDIHMYVEVRKDGRWESADKWGEDEDGIRGVEYSDYIYRGRNYGLFAILAGVRNGFGFAGVKTGEGYNPISPPRGLPDDVSAQVRAEAERWGEDGHSHSCLTVEELMAYDWTQMAENQGWVDAKTFEKWNRRGGVPEEYCGAVSGPKVRHVTNDEMLQIIASGKASDNVYTMVKWTIPYSTVASGFLSGTMPRLWRLGAPSEVRIVFWFDN